MKTKPIGMNRISEENWALSRGALCCHEAGHASAGILLDIDVTKVRVRSDGSGCEYASDPTVAPARMAAMVAAGGIAKGHLHGGDENLSWGDWEILRSLCVDNENCPPGPHSVLCREGYSLARHVLSSYWPAVRKVADGLDARGEL